MVAYVIPHEEVRVFNRERVLNDVFVNGGRTFLEKLFMVSHWSQNVADELNTTSAHFTNTIIATAINS